MMEEKKQIMHDNDITIQADEMIFNPFNPLNKEIRRSDIVRILKTYGLPGQITNIQLYKRAFIHRSYVRRPYVENVENNITIAKQEPGTLPLKTKSNERLEFLGDGILECITKYYNVLQCLRRCRRRHPFLSIDECVIGAAQ